MNSLSSTQSTATPAPTTTADVEAALGSVRALANQLVALSEPVRTRDFGDDIADHIVEGFDKTSDPSWDIVHRLLRLAARDGYMLALGVSS